MAKETNKWGNQFDGEPLVALFIPKDKLNKENAKWLCINGEEIWLAVGKPIQVPQSVATLWNQSYTETLLAEEKMSDNIQIQA